MYLNPDGQVPEFSATYLSVKNNGPLNLEKLVYDRSSILNSKHKNKSQLKQAKKYTGSNKYELIHKIIEIYWDRVTTQVISKEIQDGSQLTKTTIRIFMTHLTL